MRSLKIPFKKRPHLGLEITQTEIRFLQFTHDYRISAFALHDIPEGIIQDDQIKDKSSLVNLLKPLVKQNYLSGIDTAIALPMRNVMSKRLKMPKPFTAEECQYEISQHLTDYFPGIFEELCFDFVIEKNTETQTHDIFLVAARQQQLNDYIDVLTQAHLKATHVDIDFFAAMRALAFSTERPPVFALLDKQAKNTQFMIVEKENLISSQTLNLSDTACITTQLVEQITLIHQLHLASNAYEPIQTIFLSGYPWLTSAEITVCAQTLGIAFKPVDPFSHLNTVLPQPLKQAKERMLVSCGLALPRKRHGHY